MDESLEKIFELLSLESVSCCPVLVCGVTYAGTGSVMSSAVSLEIFFCFYFSFRFLLCGLSFNGTGDSISSVSSVDELESSA